MQEKYDDFLNNWKSQPIGRYQPSQFNLHKGWLKEIGITHEKIRKLLGDTHKEYIINTGNNQTGITDKNKILDLFNSLCINFDKDNVPGTFIASICHKTSNYHGHPTKTQVIDGIENPKIKDGDHSAWDISKSIKDILKSSNLNKIAKFNCEKLFNKITQEWKKCNVTKDEFKAIIDTRGHAFCMIGEYPNVDSSSCFKFSSGYNSKIMISELDNTFVVTFSKTDKVFSRIMGFFDEPTSSMNFFNFYFAKDVIEGNVLESLKLISADLLKSDADKLKINMDLINLPDGIYLNPYMNLTISKEKLYNPIYLESKKSGYRFKDKPPCHFCEKSGLTNLTEDGFLICRNCVQSLGYVVDTIRGHFFPKIDLIKILLDSKEQITSKKTYQELIKAYKNRIQLV